MTPGEHVFRVQLEWTGEPRPPRAAGRAHVVRADGKMHAIEGSAARAFHGDAARWNPEELLLAALADCHLLSYLYVTARDGIVVTGYEDAATATLREDGRGGGAIVEVVLRPHVLVADASMLERAADLHAEASELCFIASSVAFPVRHEPTIEVAPA
ncbi:OsmC family peroxiredoxin [Agromyces sp. CFH 90414]|uniref:OsmC family peroxiredoxin n=1 Tax=Agromyces agglutinans TaxID=2662258 RepID=A0A6I2FAX1_9MICO|nr:OsmC family protein [Agromyces agglutinans]MRG61481.1 OsmC family peroxiredoxin [Agromyces agglutinans]